MKSRIYPQLRIYWLLSLFVAIILAFTNNHSSKLNILIITGGHNFEREHFFNLFDEMHDIEYDEAIHPEANQKYSSQSIDDYDVIVFYDMVQQIDDDQKKSLIDLLDKGKGMIFLHHSLVSYQNWDEFENIIGGRYYLQNDTTDEDQIIPSTYKHDVQVPVRIVDKNHPVVQGIKDFNIHDEVYGGFNVLPTVNPLLTTTHAESGEIIGWTNKYLNSRIVYIQLGHDHHAYENPNYRRLLKNAIHWVQNK